MSASRHFFADGTFLGSAPAPRTFVHGELAAPIGIAYFCPICAEVWATAIIAGEPTQVRHRHCAKHDPGTLFGSDSLGRVSPFDIPGSLFLAEDRTYNESLPAGAIQRELLLHLRWAAHHSSFPPHIASTAENLLSLLSAQRSTT